jgi:hypothetical protein
MTLYRFIHRPKKDEDRTGEIEPHPAHEPGANAPAGLSRRKARRHADLRFVNPPDRSFPWLEDGWRELRSGSNSGGASAGRRSLLG